MHSLNLGKLLETTPQRERSGSPTSSRYDYQKDWAILELVEMHNTGTNYCMIMEYHDDILVLDGADEPMCAHFFQVKTKDTGPWKIGDLIRIAKKNEEASKGKTPRKKKTSYLAKLVGHVSSFGKYVGTLNFVSNAPYDILTSDGNASTLEHFAVKDIIEIDRTKVIKAIEKQLGVTLEFAAKTHFIRSPMSVIGHDVHVRGVLSDYLEHRFPGAKFSIGPLYKTLFDEIKRKTDCMLPLASLSEIIQKKGITRDGFEAMIQEIGEKVDYALELEQIKRRLDAEGFSYIVLKRIERDWSTYLLERSDSQNILLQELAEAIRALIPSFETFSLSGYVGQVAHLMMLRENVLQLGKSESFVMAAALVEFSDYANQKR
jgi:hypothetical protein